MFGNNIIKLNQNNFYVLNSNKKDLSNQTGRLEGRTAVILRSDQKEAKEEVLKGVSSLSEKVSDVKENTFQPKESQTPVRYFEVYSDVSLLDSYAEKIKELTVQFKKHKSATKLLNQSVKHIKNAKGKISETHHRIRSLKDGALHLQSTIEKIEEVTSGANKKLRSACLAQKIYLEKAKEIIVNHALF